MTLRVFSTTSQEEQPTFVAQENGTETFKNPWGQKILPDHIAVYEGKTFKDLYGKSQIAAS